MKKRNNGKRPSYLKFLWSGKKVQLFASLLGLAGSIGLSPSIIKAASDNPVIIIILALIALYGFTVGMILQPLLLYRKLVKTNYWEQ